MCISSRNCPQELPHPLPIPLPLPQRRRIRIKKMDPIRIPSLPFTASIADSTAASASIIVAAAAQQQKRNDPMIVSGTSHRESPLSRDILRGEVPLTL